MISSLKTNKETTRPLLLPWKEQGSACCSQKLSAFQPPVSFPNYHFSLLNHLFLPFQVCLHDWHPIRTPCSSSLTLLSGVIQRLLSFLNPREPSRPLICHLAYATLYWFYLSCSRLLLLVRWPIPEKVSKRRYSDKQQHNHIVLTLLFHPLAQHHIVGA